MAKKWLNVALILILILSMLGGCQNASNQEESASSDSYVEEEEKDPVVLPNQGDSNQSGSDQKGDSNLSDKQEDQGHEKPSDDKKDPINQEDPKPSDKDDGEEDPKPSDKEKEDEEEDDYQPPVVEDPYANTPISKTEATTSDGIKYYKENALGVVSYNVRCANDPDGHSVIEREPRLKKVLNEYDADLMGFQEVTLDWELRLLTMLSEEYDSIVEYRNSGGGAEANPIFYKKSKFKLLDSGTFWLSDTPEEESKAWGADHYRICTWVKLQVRQTGAVFHYFNTHVDYKPEPQVPSAELLIKRAKSISGSGGVILTGDFNLTSSAPAYKTLTTYWGDTNMLTVKNTTQGTLPNYGKNPNGGNIIDFCFVTPKTIKATSYKVMTDMVGGKYVSDHFGVYSKMIIL